jgi:predicted ATP-grasp superfamily ATP-dependent carboligase
VLDKVLLAEEARSAGLPVPRTAAATEEELIRTQYPVIVKARLHAVPGRARLEAALCRDAAAARAAGATMREAGGEPILQERVEGPLVAYTALADRDGNVVAALQQEAEATWPPEAGVSVRARTVPIDPELAAGAARLLTGLRWFGIAELQFVAPHGQRPVLIDLNGRFYGSLALALAAGLNLPAGWAALATGRQPPPARTARVGVRYQWIEGDLRRALRERDGLVRALAFAPRAAHSVWSVRDPAPSLRRAAALTRGALRKLVRR